MITPTTKPPRTADILDKVKVLINVSAITDVVDSIVIARHGTIDVEAPTPDASGMWKRIILMPIRKGLGTGPEHMDKVTSYPFQARVDVNPPNTDFNADILLEYIHELIYLRLQYQKISPAGADQVYVITRTRRPLSGDRDESGFIYSSSKYLTVVKPN